MDTEELLELIQNHYESEVLDFKENLDFADEIGQYISALGNSAILSGNEYAFLIWGIKDVTKELVGTAFNPWTAKAKQKSRENASAQMPLITFLEKMLDPRLDLKFEEHQVEGNRIVSLTIEVKRANQPIKFSGVEYIRSGSSKEKLQAFREKERAIWKALESKKFELEVAKANLTWEQVRQLLDVEYYRDFLGISSWSEVIQSMIDDHVLLSDGDNQRISITNLGAFSFARRLSDFENQIANHAMRITKYDGAAKYSTVTSDYKSGKGVILGFEKMIEHIMALVPKVEKYDALRENIYQFPQIAIRELVANALTHQDFSISGQSPTIEIFNNRLEVANPGVPLIKVDRLLDLPPRSRNEELASLFFKFRLFEGRGTGIDKIMNAIELTEQPAPQIIESGNSTVVKLKGRKKFSDLTQDEKNEIVYWHASLKYIEDEAINNASLRKRFGVPETQTAAITRVIASASDAGLIKPYDATVGKKFMKYVPFWAN
ncbi:MAG TPA: ATP-binding protein [Lactobacillaceae bacterium]|jgi:predicted HTH transcriptional regulator